MRAVICHDFGPPESLVVEDVPDPVAGPGEVLVEVKASVVTFPDTLMLENKYQFSPNLPYIPGGEVAGVVLACGDDVTNLSVGDRVVGGLGTVGGYAELAAISAGAATRLPDGVSFEAATGLNYAYGTTLYGLKHRGNLKEGETLVILGAGGSVGLSAVELGKHFGARVIAAASSEEKLDLCRERGADETINYHHSDLKTSIKELTGGNGADVIYDCVGGDYAEAALRAIAWEGRFLVVGFPAGIPAIKLNLTLLKGCQIVGVFYGAMAMRNPKLASEIASELISLTDKGVLKPYVSEVVPLERAGEALRSLIDRKARGKLVVAP